MNSKLLERFRILDALFQDAEKAREQATQDANYAKGLVDEALALLIVSVPDSAGHDAALEIPWKCLRFMNGRWRPLAGTRVSDASAEYAALVRILGHKTTADLNNGEVEIEPGMDRYTILNRRPDIL